jgi:hypothetical protein
MAGAGHALTDERQGTQPGLSGLCHQFGRGSGRGRPQVGHKVRNGEVGLVAHTADHGHRALNERARELLVVEGPQVFDRAAAAHQQDHIDRRRLAPNTVRPARSTAGTNQRQRRDQVAGRLRALHLRPAPAPPGMCGTRRRSAVTTSCSAAAPARSPGRCRAASAATARLRAASNRPSRLQPRLEPQELLEQCAPCPPASWIPTISCRSPRGSYTPSRPRTSTCSPSRGAKSSSPAARRNIAQRIWPHFRPSARSSNARWHAREKPEISPRTADRIEPRVQRIRHGAAQRANLPDSWRQCWDWAVSHQ